MGDLKNPRVIWAKGVLFLILGSMASAMLLMELPSVRVAMLLAITVWAFCRAYYFAFYVVEHYVDRKYRFSGLIDFAKFVARRK